MRLLGISPTDLSLLNPFPTESEILENISDSTVALEIPYAQEPEFISPTTSNNSPKNQRYPFFRGR